MLAGLLSVHGAKGGGGGASDRGGDFAGVFSLVLEAAAAAEVLPFSPRQAWLRGLEHGCSTCTPERLNLSPLPQPHRVRGAAVEGPMNTSFNTRAKSACLGGQRLTDEPFSSSSSFCPFIFSPFPLLTLANYLSASRLSSAIQLSHHTLPSLILLPSIRRPPDSVESPLFRCFLGASLSFPCLGTCWIWG